MKSYVEDCESKQDKGDEQGDGTRRAKQDEEQERPRATLELDEKRAGEFQVDGITYDT